MNIHFNGDEKAHIAKYKGDKSPIAYILKLLHEDMKAKQGATDEENKRK